MKKRALRFWIVVFIAILIAAPSSFASGGSQNLISSLIDELVNLPASVTSLVREPIDRTITFLDKKKVYDKVRHLYETFKGHGVFVSLFNINNEDLPKTGVSFRNGLFHSHRLGNLAAVKYEKPNMITDFYGAHIGPTFWTRYSPISDAFDVGARITANDLGVPDLYSALTFRYKSLPKEFFYGVGGGYNYKNQFSFHLEETSLDWILGKQEVLPNVNVETGFGLSHVVISGGKDGDARPISSFANRNAGLRVVGLDGSNMLKYGLSVSHDTRNSMKNPSNGGIEKASVTFNQGLGSDVNFKYWKLRAEASRYVRLNSFFSELSDDKVLAFNAEMEHNKTFSGGRIPFFDLGRIDRYNSRGYANNRFMDRGIFAVSAAYRYTAWKWKTFQMDSSLFYDMGWHYKNLGDFEADELRDSFGISLRFIFPQAHVVTLDFARSDEGYNFYLKWKPRF